MSTNELREPRSTPPTGPHTAIGQKAGRLLGDESGATMIEFALVGGLFMMTLVFVLALGLVLFFNQAMDLATQRASREIMLGNVQNASVSKDSFRTDYVCAKLPASFSCPDVIVNVQTIAEGAQPGGYYGLVNSSQTALLMPASNTDAQYSPGVQQSYEYVQVLYPITFLPNRIAQLLGGGATYNGNPAVFLISTAAFRNEQY